MRVTLLLCQVLRIDGGYRPAIGDRHAGIGAADFEVGGWSGSRGGTGREGAGGTEEKETDVGNFHGGWC